MCGTGDKSPRLKGDNLSVKAADLIRLKFSPLKTSKPFLLIIMIIISTLHVVHANFLFQSPKNPYFVIKNWWEKIGHDNSASTNVLKTPGKSVAKSRRRRDKLLVGGGLHHNDK